MLVRFEVRFTELITEITGLAVAGSTDSHQTETMKIQQQIEDKLSNGLTPSHLQVINESHMHNVPPGSESHFKVVLVAEAFTGINKVKRHQQVYGILKDEMAGVVHALALHTYAPLEWSDLGEAPVSPQCMGGSKKDS